MTAAHEFTLAGGHPALDFLNTVDDWTAPQPHDHLKGFPDALRFAEAVGLATGLEAQRLGRASDAPAELLGLRRLRAVLERTFRTSIERRRHAPADLANLRKILIDAARAAELRGSLNARLTQRIPVRKGTASALRLRIATAATTLLLSPEMRHVKACPRCGWFFIDASKNQSRVWCSMDTCGARAKAGRYYRRRKRSRVLRSPGGAAGH